MPDRRIMSFMLSFVWARKRFKRSMDRMTVLFLFCNVVPPVSAPRIDIRAMRDVLNQYTRLSKAFELIALFPNADKFFNFS